PSGPSAMRRTGRPTLTATSVTRRMTSLRASVSLSASIGSLTPLVTSSPVPSARVMARSSGHVGIDVRSVMCFSVRSREGNRGAVLVHEGLGVDASAVDDDLVVQVAAEAVAGVADERDLVSGGHVLTDGDVGRGVPHVVIAGDEAVAVVDEDVSAAA